MTKDSYDHFILKGKIVGMQVLKPESNQENLKAEIAIKRREMIELGMTYGLLDEKTIRSSQQLDDLLNLYKNNRPFNFTD